MNTQKRKNNVKSKNNKRFKKGDEYNPPSPLTCVTLRQTIPDQMKVPMTYYDDIQLSGSIILDQVYNLNSIFDPDRTGVGHQPLGHDQWANFYNRCRVDTAHVSLTIVNGSSTQLADFCALASNDATSVNTAARYQAACESPFSKSTLVSYYGSNNIHQMELKYNLNQVTGVTKAKYDSDDLYSGDFGTSPAEVIVLHLATKDFAFLAAIAVQIRVEITYYVTMFDRIQLAIS